VPVLLPFGLGDAVASQALTRSTHVVTAADLKAEVVRARKRRGDRRSRLEAHLHALRPAPAQESDGGGRVAM
jgi:hypothetical protein